MPVFKRALVAIVLWASATVCVGAFAKPTRVNYLKLNRVYDQEKAIARDPSSGWIAVDSMMIGAVSENTIMAIDVFSNEVRWTYQTEVRPTMFVEQTSGSVVFGLKNGGVVKLSSEDGAEVWKTQIDSYVARDILLNASRMIVVTARQQVYSIDYKTGKTIWMYDAGLPDALTIRSMARPVEFEKELLVGTTTGEIISIDSETGKEISRIFLGAANGRFQDVVGEMSLHGSQLMISRYDGLVSMLDLRSQDRSSSVWRVALPSISTSTYRNGRYYVGCTNGEIYSLDGSTGKTAWHTQTGQAAASILITDESVIASGTDGRISEMGIKQGGIRWTSDLGNRLVGKPILFNQDLYFLTGLNSLYAFRF
jgi:outer membrane protein assembly factor BamB